MSGVDVTAAEARAAEARARLNGTVEALQAELEPRRLVSVAKAEVLGGGHRAARASMDAARRNPAAVAGAGTLLLAFLNRKRIARLLSKKKS
jgi:DNA-binding IclR family transcriptional regulator